MALLDLLPDTRLYPQQIVRMNDPFKRIPRPFPEFFHRTAVKQAEHRRIRIDNLFFPVGAVHEEPSRHLVRNLVKHLFCFHILRREQRIYFPLHPVILVLIPHTFSS